MVVHPWLLLLLEEKVSGLFEDSEDNRDKTVLRSYPPSKAGR